MIEKNQPSKKEKITVLVLLAISVLYFGGCWKLKLGSWSNPGPGFIPLVVGFPLLVSSCIKFYQVYFPKKIDGKSSGEDKDEGKNYWAVYGILLSIILYPILLGYLNFLITTALVLFFSLCFSNTRIRFRRLCSPSSLRALPSSFLRDFWGYPYQVAPWRKSFTP